MIFYKGWCYLCEYRWIPLFQHILKLFISRRPTGYLKLTHYSENVTMLLLVLGQAAQSGGLSEDRSLREEEWLILDISDQLFSFPVNRTGQQLWGDICPSWEIFFRIILNEYQPIFASFSVVCLCSVVLGHDFDKLPGKRWMLGLSYPKVGTSFVHLLILLHVLLYDWNNENNQN